MIHTYRLFGLNIVLDVNSGAVHVLDDVSFDVVNTCNELINSGYAKDVTDGITQKVHKELSGKYDSHNISEALDEIILLDSKGLIFSRDELSDYSPELEEHESIKAMCLHVAHDCNMKCKYCFASKGDFGTGRKLMDKHTAFRAMDFLVHSSKGRRNLEVDFFGGEPLMNMGVVRDTVKYARSLERKHNKVFRFTITTNGVLLTEEMMDYFNREFDNVVMSLDGREETHDRMRTFENGRGSYSFILPRIKMGVKKRGNRDHFVRGTYTAYNIDFSKDVLHLADLGFKIISVEPVVTSPEYGYALTHDILPQIFREYESLAFECDARRRVGRGFSFFHFEIDLDQGPCMKKRLKGCGAGYEYIAVTPEGDIYPCHQFVGNDEFVMGNINQSDTCYVNQKISKMFRCNDITTKQECRNCWAKFYCGGGCSASAYFSNGSLDKPYEIGCLLEKKRVECAIWLKANSLLKPF